MISARHTVPVAVALLSLWTAAAAAGPRVLVVLSKPDAPYVALVESVRQHLAPARAAQTEIVVRKLDEFDATEAQAPLPTLIVAVGVEAGRRLAQAKPPVPILHTLLPRAAALELLRGGRDGKNVPRDSAIFLDQPIGRQLDLIRLALPRQRRVAALLGPATQSLASELREAARARSLAIETATLSRGEDMLPTLEDLLDGTDVLLSVADPLVYHSETIHHLLLTTYRYKIPVLGLSKAYVDAGALLAVYASPEDVGHQVAQIVAALPTTGAAALPAPGYSRYFSVAVNRRVAASLDLVLESDVVLLQKLEALANP